MEAIQFEHVNFQYPGCEKKALEDISMTIYKSQFVVLCGRSGCGKSTLLRHLKLSMMPYGTRTGSVKITGKSIDMLFEKEAAYKIGFVQQNPDSQIVTDKVWHELAFGLESLGLSNTVIQKRVSEMASFFGIQTWFHKSIGELSGGQKQLLNLASVMAMQPEIVALDEPTAQLDPIASKEFLDILYKINQELGTTIFLSEHRLEDVFPLADRAVVMDHGRILVDDTIRAAGKYLSETQHDMYYGLPTVMRLYTSLGAQGDCPVTVREGRNWLDGLLSRKLKPQHESQSYCSSKKTVKADAGQEILLELTDIYFRYEKKSPDVLKGVNLNIHTGELLGIVGGNGVGKSTLIKVIAGWHKPYRGKIIIGGKTVAKAGRECAETEMTIGVLPQNPQAVFTEITVEEDLYEALSDQDLTKQDARTRVQDMLKLMELTDLRQENPYDLSGGEQQRLALAKILLTNPKLLLLDEPTKGLDPFFKQTFAQIISKLKEEQITIVMVTHDIEFCAEYADRCAMFFDGTCVSMSGAKEFFCGNYFYTTSAHRIARPFFPQAVTCQEVIELCQETLR